MVVYFKKAEGKTFIVNMRETSTWTSKDGKEFYTEDRYKIPTNRRFKNGKFHQIENEEEAIKEAKEMYLDNQIYPCPDCEFIIKDEESDWWEDSEINAVSNYGKADTDHLIKYGYRLHFDSSKIEWSATECLKKGGEKSDVA